MEGAEQLTDWPLYVCLVLLITTAIAQVNLTPTLPLALTLTTDPEQVHCIHLTLTSTLPTHPTPSHPHQVNYINRGMVNFGNSQLIPAHYVTFTLFSVLATSTFYQAR